MEWNISVSGVW